MKPFRCAMFCAPILCAFAGCSGLMPNAGGLGVESPSRFAFLPEYALKEAAEHTWWQGLKDPVLDMLVERALVQNLDLEAARARMMEAKAILGTVGVQANLSGTSSIATTLSRGEAGRLSTRTAEFQPLFLYNLFQASRREKDAALMRAVSAEFEQPAVRLGLLLEVVTAYAELRQSEAELLVRHRALRAQEKIVQSLRQRLELGDALSVDLRQAEAGLAASRAVLPSLRAERDIRALRIATLLAEPADRVLTELHSGRGKQPEPDGNIDPGVPAALIKNRPDIRSAEAEYLASIADIGVAEAQLYPSLRISGSIRLAGESSIGVSPSLSVPVLGRNVLRAQTAATQARAQQAHVAWRQSVLNATEEVQIALVQVHQADKQLRLLRESVAANRDAVELARTAFGLGEMKLNELLSVELNSASAEINVTAAKLTYAIAWAQLNVAIGMGWNLPGLAEIGAGSDQVAAQ